MSTSAFAAIRRYHLVRVWTVAVWIVAAALATDAVLARMHVDPRVRLAVLGVFLCVALASRVFSRESLQSTARWLDGKLGSRNRLEAIAEVANRQDPLAHAMRHEVRHFLEPRRLPVPANWITAVAAVIGIAFYTFLIPVPEPAARASTRNAPLMPASSAPASTETEEHLAPPAAPWAQIEWLTPDPDTTATPTEELPLRAVSEAEAALRDVSLAIWVDGEPRASIRLMAELPRGLHDIAAILHLSPLAVKQGSVISYHITAQRVRESTTSDGPEWPATTSPLQIVRIAPPDDGMAGIAVDDELERQLHQIQQLRRDQVAVLRDAFALSHELPPKDDPSWKDLVEVAGFRAQSIRDRTVQLSNAAMPASDKSELLRASDQAAEAAALLGAGTPEPTLAPAHRALVSLVAVELSTIRRVQAARTRASASETPAAPATKSSLPPRATTHAGRLEKIAAEQAMLAGQLAARQETSETFTAQDRLSREIQKLAGEALFAPEINTPISIAAISAKEAARQLNEQDPTAAMEPATRAAQSLAESVSRMEELGRQRASQVFLHVQRQLVSTAMEIRFAEGGTSNETSPASDSLRRVREILAQEALREQTAGSAEAAQLLELLKAETELLPDENVQDALMAMGQLASDCSTKLVTKPDDLAKAVDELNRAKAGLQKKNLDRTSLKALHTSAEVAIQRVRSLTDPADPTSSASPGRHNRLSTKATRDQSTPTSKPGKDQNAKSKDRKTDTPEENKPKEKPDEKPGEKKPAQKDGPEPPPEKQQKPDDCEGTERNSATGKPKPEKGAPSQAGSGAPQSGTGHARPSDGLLDGSGISGASEPLSDRIEGTLRMADMALRAARRVHVLATGNPAEAPPAYRPAVADYFEALATGSGSTQPPSPASTAASPNRP